MREMRAETQAEEQQIMQERIHSDARLESVAVLKRPELELELFEFTQPQPARGDPGRPVCDHGITHFCIEVEDIEEEYERLRQAGARPHCPPLDFGAAKATYVRDPDGNVVELLELITLAG